MTKPCTQDCGGSMRPETRYENRSFVTVWKCQNCSNVVPRRVNKTHNERVSPSQTEAMEQFKARALAIWGTPEAMEVKRESFEIMGNADVMFVLEVGRKGDEGTMAEVLCRDYFVLIVGRRGALSTTIPNGKGGEKKLRGMHECLYSNVTKNQLRAATKKAV